MTLKSDNKASAFTVLFPRRGENVKVIQWCGDYALCEGNFKGMAKRCWIHKSKLK